MRKRESAAVLGPLCAKCHDPQSVAPIPCGLGYQCVACFSRPFRLVRAAVRMQRSSKRGEGAGC
jgi:hypothetical protein